MAIAHDRYIQRIAAGKNDSAVRSDFGAARYQPIASFVPSHSTPATPAPASAAVVRVLVWGISRKNANPQPHVMRNGSTAVANPPADSPKCVRSTAVPAI